ncbi:MAG TPA: glycoside hydrolase family 99-like domain-containing protein, partial [Candidatus Paceibacterota bacterium]
RAWHGGEKEIIMPQTYGGKDEWKKHYDYLLMFFKDNRYIKIDNKPLFILYRTSSIEDCTQMIEYWNKLCKEDGFDGIYIIEELNSYQNQKYCSNSDAVIEFEPMYTISYDVNLYIKIRRRIKSFIRKRIATDKLIEFYDYDYIWNKIINRKRNCINKKIFLGAFVDWDNSARKKNNGAIFKGASPQKFKSYLKKQLDVSKELNNEFLFINAWNEWGEGTYLEPDKKNEFKYLEAVRDAIKENREKN